MQVFQVPHKVFKAVRSHTVKHLALPGYPDVYGGAAQVSSKKSKKTAPIFIHKVDLMQHYQSLPKDAVLLRKNTQQTNAVTVLSLL